MCEECIQWCPIADVYRSVRCQLKKKKQLSWKSLQVYIQHDRTNIPKTESRSNEIFYTIWLAMRFWVRTLKMISHTWNRIRSWVNEWPVAAQRWW